MSRIHDDNGIVLYVYPGHHEPPHIHVFCDGRQLRIDLLTGELISGAYPAGKKKAILKAFDASRYAALRQWKEYNDNAD